MKPRKKTVAILFALLLGFLGAHKFYLRRQSAGVFYVFLTLISTRMMGFSVATLLSWLDALSMLMMDQRTFDKKYNWERMKQGYNPQKRSDRASRKRNANPRRRPATVNRRKSNAAKRQGIKQMEAYDVLDAVASFEKALKEDPNDADLHFRLASAFSLLERTSSSLKHIEIALKLGHDNDAIFIDDHLAYIRIQPAFERFVKNNYQYIPLAGDDKRPNEDVILQQKQKESHKRQ